MEEDFIHGDKRLALTLTALVFLALAFLILSSALGLDRAATETAVLRATIVLVAGGLVRLFFAVYFGTVALRTAASRTWPPPHMKVPWRIRRRRGREALVMATACLVVAALFATQLVGTILGLLRMLS
jgi:hypothetical protein